MVVCSELVLCKIILTIAYKFNNITIIIPVYVLLLGIQLDK